ncbi:MAG: GNAT family N-acetyltransferase [Frankiales bacterium]|nr:GNAT family N-acetyltransferase [Frankiales bacterium]
MTVQLCETIVGTAVRDIRHGFEIALADGPDIQAYRALRRRAFCDELGLFERSDTDEHDDTATVLVARLRGRVVGGVRLYEVTPGWWHGGRLVVAGDQRGAAGTGSALVAAACAQAEAVGALRFEAAVLPGNAALFARLGWDVVRSVQVGGRAHILVGWARRRVPAPPRWSPATTSRPPCHQPGVTS